VANERLLVVDAARDGAGADLRGPPRGPEPRQRAKQIDLPEARVLGRWQPMNETSWVAALVEPVSADDGHDAPTKPPTHDDNESPGGWLGPARRAPRDASFRLLFCAGGPSPAGLMEYSGHDVRSRFRCPFGRFLRSGFGRYVIDLAVQDRMDDRMDDLLSEDRSTKPRTCDPLDVRLVRRSTRAPRDLVRSGGRTAPPASRSSATSVARIPPARRTTPARRATRALGHESPRERRRRQARQPPSNPQLEPQAAGQRNTANECGAARCAPPTRASTPKRRAGRAAPEVQNPLLGDVVGVPAACSNIECNRTTGSRSARAPM